MTNQYVSPPDDIEFTDMVGNEIKGNSIIFCIEKAAFGGSFVSLIPATIEKIEIKRKRWSDGYDYLVDIFIKKIPIGMNAVYENYKVYDRIHHDFLGMSKEQKTLVSEQVLVVDESTKNKLLLTRLKK